MTRLFVTVKVKSTRTTGPCILVSFSFAMESKNALVVRKYLYFELGSDASVYMSAVVFRFSISTGHIGFPSNHLRNTTKKKKVRK